VEAGRAEPILQGICTLLIAAIDIGDMGGGAGGSDAGGEDQEGDASIGPVSVQQLHTLRRALLKDNPELFALRMASMHSFEDALSGVVQLRLSHDDPGLADDPEALHQRARLVTYVALAGMRHAWSCWADHGGVEPLSDRLRSSFAQLAELGTHVH
jgi:hypothetical protein